MDPLFAELARMGLLGILLVLSLFALRDRQIKLEAEKDARIADAKAKDERILEETQARIDDSKRFTEMAMRLQQEVIQSVNQLGRITESFSQITKEFSSLALIIREVVSDWKIHRKDAP